MSSVWMYFGCGVIVVTVYCIFHKWGLVEGLIAGALAAGALAALIATN